MEKKNYDIVVVEDEVETQKTLGHMLKGYNFVFCDSEKSMKEVLSEGDTKIIVMDIGLRGSKNGLDIVRELRKFEKYKSLPIICISSYINHTIETEAGTAGVDEFLSKPFTKRIFLEVIERMLLKGKLDEEVKKREGEKGNDTVN